VLDERSAAFFALGLAKQEMRPVALVCTSGTAAANYLPAVIEAREGGGPLLVLTADRPPELRACASGQTIDQQKLYGVYPNFFHELAVPELTEERLAYLRQTLAARVRADAPAAARARCISTRRSAIRYRRLRTGVTNGLCEPNRLGRFFRRRPAPVAPLISTALRRSLADAHGTDRGRTVRSRPIPRPTAATVGEIARRLGWPVLADGLSPLRNRADAVPGFVTASRRDPPGTKRRRSVSNPEAGAVPRAPGRPARCCAPGSSRGRGAHRSGHASRSTTAMRCTVARRCCATSLPPSRQLPPLGPSRMATSTLWAVRRKLGERPWIRALAAESEHVRRCKAAWLLAQAPARRHAGGRWRTRCRCATSESVLARRTTGALRPVFNRGANGIDGTLSTALGAAHGGRPAVLLTGDLALLHDSERVSDARRSSADPSPSC
jgi:2-succinyl-5-enolpyruvyl-6-hydroxy-3-cyclohexene-1-carboxylate synthase